MSNKVLQKKLREKRTRRKIRGRHNTLNYPRLSIFRSLKHLYVQIIDDQGQKTLVSAKDTELKENGNSIKVAENLGELIAKKALDKKITKVVFDRGSYRYHGRVKALAESARKAGLKF